ncbi:M20 family metallopeptidase [Maridesulfovibrio sp.]|uniref:M20 family metallopeptidase n=1 Tax=Maridesulfovibrio sp. TaxID=2795000 RepID=UPI0029CA4328|nr:M20 family metallopeptidase [Maridesulfovibrio sp.]
MTEQQTYDNFLKDFEKIINTDSASENLDGVAEVAEFLKAKFDTLGLEAEITREGERGVPCLKACTASKNGRYDFMFIGHMDTVFPTGEAAKRPFKIEDGRALGPGTNDMKGGLLVALYAIEKLKNEGNLDKVAICVAFNGDEEIGSENSRAWIEKNAANSDHVFVFEPCRPDYRHVMHRKGGGVVHITASGISAHSGANPERGANALVELAGHISAIHALNDMDNAITAQSNIIRSGEKHNIIPDNAELVVDVRVGTIEEAAFAEKFFAKLPETNYVEGASISISGGVDRPPMEPTDKTMEMWEILHGEAAKIGIDSAYISTGGCSDGNWTAAMGIPTIDGMGPVGENSHREDEYMELDSILPMISIVANTTLKLASKN